MIRRLAAALLVFAAFAVLGSTLFGVVGPSGRPAAAAAPAVAALAPAIEEDEPGWACATMGNRTCGDELPGGAVTADAAYLADLLGPDTDVTAEQAAAMTEQGRRIAALLSHPEDVPAGAETPTREAIVETLTTPGSLPNGGAYSLDEATKLVDCALAAYAS